MIPYIDRSTRADATDMDTLNHFDVEGTYHRFRGMVFRLIGVFQDANGQVYFEYQSVQGRDAGVRKRVYLEDLDSEWPVSVKPARPL